MACSLQYELIPESLKNVVLVMHATNILVPPSDLDVRTERQRSLWAATQERIDRFLPGFLASVIPAGPSDALSRGSTDASAAPM
jgi:brefeldin A-resistance guanine nucleotide exchange factor 1